jgi:hypothetical protein
MSRRWSYALVVASALAAGCAVPRLHRVPGSDLAGPRHVTPRVSAGSGCRGVTVAGPGVVTTPQSAGACAQVGGDTLPQPGTDRTQPKRPTP